MNITFYGHSSFSIEAGGKTLVFDPFISHNPKAAFINVLDISADYVLLSHAHFDHVADALTIARQNNATIVSTYEIANWAQANGHDQVHPLAQGGQWKFDFGTIKAVNAVHSSSFQDGTYGGNPAGFIISAEGKTFYYAGDTALMYDMKMFGELYQLDFCLLPIGDNFTMGVDDAVIASDWLKCNTIIGMHYDTFGYIEIDQMEAISKFEAKGKNLYLLPIADTIDL